MTEPSAESPVRIYIDLIGDLFHAGQLRHLEKAKSLGDILVVGVFDDETATRFSHVPVMTLDERIAVIAALRCVDEVIPAAPAIPDASFFGQYDIDHACLSDDFGDPARQEGLADLLEGGTAIVFPYTEALSTAGIVSRITGVVSGNQVADMSENSATVHPPAAAAPTDAMQILADIQQTQTTALGILGAIAGGQFKRSWLLDRERLGDENWVAFRKCLARNEIELARHPATDPRFVAALVSLTKNISRPGERINLIGAAAHLVGSALVAMDRHVTIIRPGTVPPSGSESAGTQNYDVVHCGWREFPDACPAADSMAVLSPSASAVLVLDSELFFAATSRIKRDVLLSVDFSPEGGTNYSPRSDDNHFVFSDVFTRNVFHVNNFFEVKDVMTTVAGVPRAEGARGCNRLSRVSMVDEDKHGPNFRYLDGEAAMPAGTPDEGGFIRWYHGSVLPIGGTTA